MIKIEIFKDFYLFYSYLNASIGFKWAAFLAGKNPKTTPIKVEKAKAIKKDIKTDDVWSFIGDLFNLQNS